MIDVSFFVKGSHSSLTTLEMAGNPMQLLKYSET